MRNQVAMKQYNPSKPAKYGLLFKSLNDGRFPYTYNSLVYAGKPQQGGGPYYINTIGGPRKNFSTNNWCQTAT